MKHPTPEAYCAEDVFQIQSPNSIPNKRETELDSTFETS